MNIYRLSRSIQIVTVGSKLVISSPFRAHSFTYDGLFSEVINYVIEFGYDTECIEVWTNRIERKFRINKSMSDFIVKQLIDHAILIRAPILGMKMVGRHARQVEFFENIEVDMCGEEINYKLQNTRIGIVGAGSYGSWLIQLCAMTGVAAITIADGDIIEESNLNRQALFRSKDVGSYKVFAIKDRVEMEWPGTSIRAEHVYIETERDFKATFGDCGFVFIPFGYPRSEKGKSVLSFLCNISESCGIPYLILGQAAVGPLWIPEGSIGVRKMLESKDYNLFVRNSRVKRDNNGSYAPRVAQVAAAAYWEYTKYKAGLVDSVCVNSIFLCDIARGRHIELVE